MSDQLTNELDGRSRMRRRGFTALAIAALVFGAMAPTAAAAGSSKTTRFQRIDVSKIDPQLLPALIDPNRVVDVMIQLAGRRPGWQCH